MEDVSRISTQKNFIPFPLPTRLGGSERPLLPARRLYCRIWSEKKKKNEGVMATLSTPLGLTLWEEMLKNGLEWSFDSISFAGEGKTESKAWM